MRILIIAVSMLHFLIAPADARLLDLADYLQWERVSDPVISPDGSQIVYTRRQVDADSDRWRSELWIMNADGGEKRQFGQGRDVRWSPQGDRIAYVKSDSNGDRIFVRDADSADESPATPATDRYAQIREIAWSPDGETIAFRATVPMEPVWPLALPGKPEGADWTEDPFVTDRLHYKIDGVGYKTGYDHIFTVESSGGEPRQLTSGEWDVGARAAGLNSRSRLEWSPDGAWIFFDGSMQKNPNGMTSHVFRLRVSNGDIRQLTKKRGFWASPRISPDGRTLAYIGYEGDTPDGATYPGYEIRQMKTDGSGDKTIIANWSGRIYTQLAAVADFMEWKPDGSGLYILAHAQGASNIEFISLSGARSAVTEGVHQFYPASMNDNGAAAGILATFDAPGNVAVADLSDGALDTLTRTNADLLEDVELGEVEEIWYESDPDVRVQGWILKPPNFDPKKDYPLILDVHGGPHAMYGAGFSFSRQEFAANGYVVLFVNPRGSLGYGTEFANAIDNAFPGRSDYVDLMAGVDEVLDRGYVDKNRLFVTGCSGGGTLTNWIVTQTDRFRAAAPLCSISNWLSMVGTSDIIMGVHHMYKERFWDDPAAWLEHSPLMHVKNVKTPTLLITALDDLRTPAGQAEEFYAALQMRGAPSRLILMYDEPGHGTRGVPSNMLRTQLYIRQWFGQYGGAPVSAQSAQEAD